MFSLAIYKAISIALIIGVIGTSGATVYYYRLQGAQQTKPLPETLKIQLFSQPVKFASWNSTIIFSSSSTFSCPGNSKMIPGTIVITGLNFTEDLSGRDPGSTWVDFRPLSTGLFVFSKADVTISLITDILCSSSSYTSLIQLKAKALIPSVSSPWRVLSSGNYTLFSDYIAYTTPPSTSSPLGLIANETWTVTTIS